MSNQQSFADIGVSKAVINAMANHGITEPFAIQRDVIGDVLQGRDVLVKSPTGSGKTLAFGVPLVDRTRSDGPRPAALVLAPTRELVTQIVAQISAIAHARALRVTAVYGGVGLQQQAKNAARSQIIVATPGRLEDLLARRAFRLDRIETLVLDEADRMLDMGFRPVVDRIIAQCPAERQTLFFSATLDGEAGRLAQRYTHDPAMHEHGPTERRASLDVEHRFVQVAHPDRVDALVHELEQERDLTLVFVRTKRGADRLVKRLGFHGIDAVSLHGNKSQRQREQALRRFGSGAVDTMVATDVAARGIDVRDISHVINFDPPADSETYVHRVGRTGRAGATGIGITLVAPSEHQEVSHMAARLGLDHPVAHGAPTPRGSAPSRSPRPAPATHPQRPPRRRRGRPRREGARS